MARLNARSRNSDGTSGHTAKKTSSAGAVSSRGRRLPTTLFPWTGEPSEVPAVDYWFRASERVWDSAHIHLQQAVRRHKTFADARRAPTPLYQPGDRVWLFTRDLRLRLPCRNLSPRYIGPFKIMRQINEVTYQLQLPPQVPHPSHISRSPPPDQLEPDEPPPPEILDEPSVYQVRNILDSWRRGGRGG